LHCTKALKIETAVHRVRTPIVDLMNAGRRVWYCFLHQAPDCGELSRGAPLG